MSFRPVLGLPHRVQSGVQVRDPLCLRFSPAAPDEAANVESGRANKRGSRACSIVNCRSMNFVGGVLGRIGVLPLVFYAAARLLLLIKSVGDGSVAVEGSIHGRL